MSYGLPGWYSMIPEEGDRCNLHCPRLAEIQVTDQDGAVALQVELCFRGFAPAFPGKIRILHLLAGADGAHPSIGCKELESVLPHLKCLLIHGVVEMVQNGTDINFHEAKLSTSRAGI